MPSVKIPKRLQETASQYVLGLLNDKQRREFEAALQEKPVLQTLVAELQATLTLTEKTLAVEPGEEYLMGQRVLLRGRLEKMERSQKIAPAARHSPGLQPVPVSWMYHPWAALVSLVAVMVLVFFVGRYSAGSSYQTIDLDQSVQDIADLLATGQLNNVQFRELNRGTKIVEVKGDVSRGLNISGTPTDQRIQKILYYLLLHDANPGTRLKAVKYLAEIPSQEEKKLVLISALLSDPNPGVRRRAAQLLKGYAPDELVVEASVKALLEDENEAIRMEVLEIMRKQPTPNMAPVLQVVSLMDENEFIRAQARQILEALREPTNDNRIEKRP